MKDIILIGGAPGTGKTTLAKKLAAHFAVPWISTDQICSILQVTESDQMTLLSKTWEGTLALIKNHHPWEGAVIEGMAILPKFVARDLKEAEGIKVFFLIHVSEEKITEVVEERSKLPWIHTKTEEQKILKIKEISEFNAMVRNTADRLKLPLIQGNEDSIFRDALGILGE